MLSLYKFKSSILSFLLLNKNNNVRQATNPNLGLNLNMRYCGTIEKTRLFSL